MVECFSNVIFLRFPTNDPMNIQAHRLLQCIVSRDYNIPDEFKGNRR